MFNTRNPVIGLKIKLETAEAQLEALKTEHVTVVEELTGLLHSADRKIADMEQIITELRLRSLDNEASSIDIKRVLLLPNVEWTKINVDSVSLQGASQLVKYVELRFRLTGTTSLSGTVAKKVFLDPGAPKRISKELQTRLDRLNAQNEDPFL